MSAGTTIPDSGLRAALRAHRGKSNALALAIFAMDAAIYVLLTWGAITWKSWVLGALAGVSIAMLFLVAHDACHGSLTSGRRLNAWVGRLAFLPSLTPYRAWELEHNQTHHVYTNLKAFDYVWRPFSPEEFLLLPWWRRALERLYRTPAGLGLYYAVEVWGRRLIVPPGRRYAADAALCVAYAVSLAYVGRHALLPGVLEPFLVWNWAMGWVLFDHHTHPGVPWFDNEAEWRAAGPQSHCTVHAVMPGMLDLVLHRLMHHPAHHLDIAVPLYRLKNAQQTLENAAAGVVVYRWSPLTLLRHLRICKLYDYRAKRWVGFATRTRCRNRKWAGLEAEQTGPPNAAGQVAALEPVKTSGHRKYRIPTVRARN